MHCLEKSPEERFQSARDLAFDLESMSGSSVTRALDAPGTEIETVEHVPPLAGALVAAAALGFIAGRATAPTHQPTFEPLTFRRGSVPFARFAPDGRTVIYTATWEGPPQTLYTAQPGNPESRSLEIRGALRSVSRTAKSSCRCRGPGARRCSGDFRWAAGAPRDVVESIRDAAWGPNGEDIADRPHRKRTSPNRVPDRPRRCTRLADGSARFAFPPPATGSRSRITRCSTTPAAA